MTIPTSHNYDGRIRTPHALTGDGTDYDAWTRELHEEDRVMRPVAALALIGAIGALAVVALALVLFLA